MGIETYFAKKEQIYGSGREGKYKDGYRNKKQVGTVKVVEIGCLCCKCLKDSNVYFTDDEAL